MTVDLIVLNDFIDELYFFCWPSDNKLVDKTSIPKNANIFTTDDQFNYIRFYLDFGPPNIAQILRFWKTLGKKLEASKQTGKPLLAITSDSPDKCTNATLLMCMFMVLEFNYKPAQALAPINDLKRNHSLVLAPYRDAGYGEATYWITISDCVHAFYAGVRELNLLNVDTFDTDHYEFYERVENGDLSWVVPGYFLALATPHDQPLAHLAKFHLDVAAGKYAPLKPTPPGLKPLIDIEDLAVHLRDKANCKAVVRLNNKLYDRQKFLKRGLDHFELYFPDGSVPPFDTIVKKFLTLCDKFLPPFPQPAQPSNQYPNHASALLNGGRGALAVHCKAGLGRTGSLICCWMIKTFGWTARQCISWCRLMRPGSVVGPQQNWLETVEQQLLQMRNTRPQSLLLNGLDINEGSEDLAKLTMGMAVPIQPRKGNRDESVTIDNNDMEWTGGQQPQQESRGYTLRNTTAK